MCIFFKASFTQESIYLFSLKNEMKEINLFFFSFKLVH